MTNIFGKSYTEFSMYFDDVYIYNQRSLISKRTHNLITCPEYCTSVRELYHEFYRFHDGIELFEYLRYTEYEDDPDIIIAALDFFSVIYKDYLLHSEWR